MHAYVPARNKFASRDFTAILPAHIKQQYASTSSLVTLGIIKILVVSFADGNSVE